MVIQRKEILLKYLLLVRQIRGVKDQNPNPVIVIFTYLNHFSPLKFNKNFVDITEKKHSGHICLTYNKLELNKIEEEIFLKNMKISEKKIVKKSILLLINYYSFFKIYWVKIGEKPLLIIGKNLLNFWM